MIRKGDILAGRYRIEDLPRGILPVVGARDLLLDRRVAVLLHPAGEDGAAAILSREASASAQLTSEHMFRIFHVGALDTGEPYSVTEFLEGSDLGFRLRRYGPLPIELGVDFLIEACDVLAEAHSKGIVHRDVKPGNLFLAQRPGLEPYIKVLGWRLWTNADTVPEFGTAIGTLPYVSPEQVHPPYDCDERSDVWALGVTLWELLAGDTPFKRTWARLAFLGNAPETPPPAPDSFEDVPRGLQAVLRKCLSGDRRGRYQNAAELAVALCEFGSDRSGRVIDRISALPQRALTAPGSHSK